MKFLVDNQLPAELARWIGAKGCDACHALDVGLARSSDNEVFQYAQSASRILISKDEDFLHLALRSDTAGFVWVRLGNCRKTQLLKALNGLGPHIVERINAGERIIEMR